MRDRTNWVDVRVRKVRADAALLRTVTRQVALEGLWGSFFSYANGTPMKTFPRRFWSRVKVRAGAPTELRDAGAIRDAVLALLDR